MGIPSKQVQRAVLESILLTLDFLVVGLRFWARRIKGKPRELNDYLIVVGLVRSCLPVTAKTRVRVNIVSFSQLVYTSVGSLV